MTEKIFNKCNRIDFLTTIYTSKKDGKYKFIGVRDKRKGHEAVFYTIPKNNNSKRPNHKGIQKKELETAWKRLRVTGELTKSWFVQNLPECNYEGGCNFKAIYGLIDIIHPDRFAFGHGKITRK